MDTLPTEIMMVWELRDSNNSEENAATSFRISRGMELWTQSSPVIIDGETVKRGSLANVMNENKPSTPNLQAMARQVMQARGFQPAFPPETQQQLAQIN